MSSRISVIVVNFNGGEVLSETLDRLEALQSEWHELIVADNGSTDGSLHRTRVEHPTAHLLELGANLGFGTANNRAAAEASGDYLLLLNSDARPEPGSIDRLKRVLDHRPRVGLVSPYLRYSDGRPQFHWAPTTSVWGEAVQILRNRFEHQPWVHRWRTGLGKGWFTAACVLLRKQAFDAIGGFDEAFFLYFEDVDLCLRLRGAGWRLTDDPEAIVTHVKGGSQSNSKSGASLHYRLSQACYYRKHRPVWEQRLLRRKILRKLHDPEARVLLDRVYESEL